MEFRIKKESPPQIGDIIYFKEIHGTRKVNDALGILVDFEHGEKTLGLYMIEGCFFAHGLNNKHSDYKKVIRDVYEKTKHMPEIQRELTKALYNINLRGHQMNWFWYESKDFHIIDTGLKNLKSLLEVEE